QSLSTETFIGGLCVVALVWLSTIYFGAPTAGNALDASWTQSLAYAFKHHFQAGVDYLFTFGPLGYIYHPRSSYDVDLFYTFIAWHIITGLFFAVIFVTYTQKIDGKIDKFIYLFLVLVVISSFPDDPRYFLGIVASVVLAISPPPFFKHSILRYTTLVGLILLFLAVVSLTKFTHFVLAGVGVLSMTVAIWHSYSRKFALIIPIVFTIFLLCIWLISGQSLLNLPTYIINSLQITSGYSDAMSGGFKITEIKLAMANIFVIMLMVLLACFIKPWKMKRFIIASMVFFGIFIAWKAGFVRHDAHSLIFFAFAVLAPFFIEYDKSMHRFLILAFRVLRYIAIFTALSGLFIAGSAINYTHSNFMAKWNQRIVNNLTTLLNLPDLKAKRDKKLDRLKQKYNLPKIRAVVGQATVDIFSWEQGVLFLNELNWHPRPVFQSYVAFTPSLIALNGDFYASEQAPEFVIFKLQAIDGQFPLMNDNEALKILLRDYQPILSEKGYFLLKRVPRSQGAVSAGETLLSREIKIGEPIDIRALSNKSLLLSLDIRKSWMGHLSSLLYKMPDIYLEIEATDGTKMSYRIIPGMTQSGFVINPLILNQADLVGWYTETALKRVATLRVVIKPEKLWLQYFFNTNLALKISENKITPYPVDDTQNLRTGLYPMFHSEPYQVSSPSNAALEEGKAVLMVHAPGEMRFRLPAGKHKFTGQFGILKGAYSAKNKHPTDGVEFSAVIQKNHGEELILFKQFLNPRVVKADRGLQTITTVSFEIEKNAELILRTHPGISNNMQSDWSFWRLDY
ncbi:hypothetical protein QUF54_05345, partial [Candidatus Marithioploca araucensis]|nr:hypothetical protein [Candidatus Marithioploca araucensis]